MIDNNINEKAINDVYKNAHIALQSISDILPKVKDKNLKKEIKSQYEGYEKIVGDISSYMKKNDIEGSKINFMQKAFMKGSISFKTMIDGSRNHIAEMMIKGTVTGITELTAMKNEKQKFNEDVASFIENLLTLEEKYQENLKKYL